MRERMNTHQKGQKSIYMDSPQFQKEALSSALLWMNMFLETQSCGFKKYHNMNSENCQTVSFLFFYFLMQRWRASQCWRKGFLTERVQSSLCSLIWEVQREAGVKSVTKWGLQNFWVPTWPLVHIQIMNHSLDMLLSSQDVSWWLPLSTHVSISPISFHLTHSLESFAVSFL